MYNYEWDGHNLATYDDDSESTSLNCEFHLKYAFSMTPPPPKNLEMIFWSCVSKNTTDIFSGT